MPAFAPPPRRRAAYLFQVAALAVVYFLAAKLGLSAAFVAEQVTAVWPPTGIALAAVLLAGFRVWPGVWLGAFVANATANEPLLVAAGIATGNTLEAVAGAWLLRRVSGPDHSLQTVRGVLALAVLAAGVSTIVSATIGNLSLCLGGVHPWSRFTSLWKIWWLGDAMGDLLVAPALLAWSSRLQRPLRPEKFGEFGAFAFSTLAASVIIFAGLLPATINRSLEYLVFPFLIWGALRFRQVGSTFATLMVAAVAIVSTLYGRGPFAQPEVQTSLVLLLVFLGASALTGLTLGAMMAERRRVEDERLELLARAQEARAAAEEAVRQRDELVATVSHDLRTPLDAILGWAVMLRQGMVAEERAAHALETIERNALAQRQLIDDLRDISRMLGGRMRLHLGPINVKHLVESVGET
ncbi:MAG: MASE1 domain-containing protein, partial [Acidobacteria bacterium]|nr:MASE1 domain-containing protein [Acidobacteriota bacterium]